MTTLFELRIPNLGESISEATLANWVKGEGEAVKADDVVAELETDKAAVELVAGQDGVLHQVVPKGATVAVGQVVAQVDPAGTAEEGIALNAGVPPAGEASTAVGSEKGDEKGLAPSVRRIVEESRLNPAKIAGTGKDGRITKEDALAAVVKAGAGAKSPGLPPGATGGGAAGGGGTAGETPALRGGGGGPAQPADSAAAANVHRDQTNQAMNTPGTTAVYAQPTAENTPGAAGGGAKSPGLPPGATGTAGVAGGSGLGDRRVEMSKLRQTIARRLVEAQHATASLTTFNEIDMSAVMALREKYKEKFEKTHAIGLGFMSFFAKAVIQAARAVPAVNASIDGTVLVYREAVHLGVAVGTEKGLMVPVIRNAHLLSMAQIEQEIKRLATKAREGKITVDEMAGGTFTITNGGVYGSLLSTPILNPPQAGILGMHKIEKRPVVATDEKGHDTVVVRPMMYVALTYDHRVIDGQQSVTFLVKVKEAIEDPSRLLLEI